MGQAPREKPTRLSEKLLKIRKDLGLSQNELILSLGMKNNLNREEISKFERDLREPSLIIILAYARLIGISTDILIDDDLDLPV